MSDQATSTNPTIVFVLGLLGLLVCQILGPIAWIMGNRYNAECAELGITPDGMATAGRVLGIVSTVFLILGFVGFALYICFGVGLAALMIVAENA